MTAITGTMAFYDHFSGQKTLIRRELRLQSWKLSQPAVVEEIDVSVRVRTGDLLQQVLPDVISR
ncbi:hypothetical protein ABIE45_006290 [Methylobacterium sp. OAE515]